MGDMYWVFHSAGILLIARDCLYILVSVGQIVAPSIFRRWGDRPSGPTDLLTFRLSNCFSIPSSCKSISSMSGYILGKILGTVSKFSLTNTDSYSCANASALSAVDVS